MKKESSTTTASDVDTDKIVNTDTTTTKTTTAAASFAPPPRPTTQNDKNPDYFAPLHKSHLSSEPNPFEQSFGNPAVETPGKTALPSLASLTSPAPLGTGNASLTGGFGWGSSLRSGPLSPAMLSGPTGDYFDNIRSYPTPNESSLRTGLTPGGGGSMFPAPSPGTQALFNSFASAGATPTTLEFGRVAVNAAGNTKTDTSSTTATNIRAQTGNMNAPNLAQHSDNEAANGLFMLAQASAPQTNGSYTNSVVVKNNGTIPTTSNPIKDDASDENNKINTRKSKRASAGKNSRKRTDEVSQTPAKKRKSNAASLMEKTPEMDDMDDMDDMDSEDMEIVTPKGTRKMTDEEKRKNFLERNRYVLCPVILCLIITDPFLLYRVAALKCRQRKKQWLQNLQSKVEIYSGENEALTAQVTALRDEVLNLKTILIAHKDCPIAQQQTSSGGYLQHGVDYGNAHYGNASYGMTMQSQQAVGMSGPRQSS